MRQFRLAVVLALCTVALSVSLCLPRAVAQEVGGWHVLKSFPTGVTAAASGDDGSWLVATKDGVFGSPDGRSFHRLSSSLDGLKVQTAAIVGDRWFLGTNGDGLYMSADAGDSWRHDTSLDCVNIASIRPDRYSAGGLYLASLCHGLYWSSDAGRSWTGMGKGIATFLVTDVVQLSTKEVIVTTRDKGLFRSADGGKSFAAVTSSFTSASWLAGDPAGSVVYVATDQKLAVSTDRGTSWKALSLPAGSVVTGLAVTAQGRLMVATTSQGVMLSKDLGTSFIRLRAGSSSLSIMALGVAGGTALYGSAEGELGTWNTSKPFLCLSVTEVQLGTVPGNQRRTSSLTVANAGEGTMSWRLENLPGYLTAEPAAGSTATRSVVGISVGPTDMSPKTYQNLVRVTSDGGEQFITIRFTIAEAAPVRIDLTIGSKTALVGGVKVALDAPAFIDAKTGRTFVPVRFIGESFSAKVTWNEAQQKVWLQLEATPQHPAILVELRIGSTTALVNGKSVALEAAPRIVAGRTFVPVRFVGEAFGGQVSWTAATRTVVIDFMP
jgi:hypothetical protein